MLLTLENNTARDWNLIPYSTDTKQQPYSNQVSGHTHGCAYKIELFSPDLASY